MINGYIGIISSENRFITFFHKADIPNKMIASVYDLANKMQKREIIVAMDITNCRHDTSADGQYVAIALYEDYKKGHIISIMLQIIDALLILRRSGGLSGLSLITKYYV